MTFFLILIVLVFIIYMISYNNRDRSKDYQYIATNQIGMSENNLIMEINGAILLQITASAKLNTYISNDLYSLRENMLLDIESISNDCNLNIGRTKAIIYACFKDYLLEYDNIVIDSVLARDLLIEITNDIKGRKEISEDLGIYSSNQDTIKFLTGSKQSIIDNFQKYVLWYNLPKNVVIKTIEATYNKYINNFSKFNNH